MPLSSEVRGGKSFYKLWAAPNRHADERRPQDVSRIFRYPQEQGCQDDQDTQADPNPVDPVPMQIHDDAAHDGDRPRLQHHGMLIDALRLGSLALSAGRPNPHSVSVRTSILKYNALFAD